MLAFVSVVHVVLCFFMIFVILLQPGKDAGMGSALGGGAASSAFGGRGAVTVLSKITAVFATLFFLTSLGLSYVGLKSSVAAGTSGSVAAPTTGQAPAEAQTPAAREASPAQGGTSPLPSVDDAKAAPATGIEQGGNTGEPKK